MGRAIQVATLVLLATLTFGVAFGIYEAWVYVPQIGSRAITALDGINGALTTVNRPKSGTLAQIDGATEDLRLVLIPIGKVAIHEQHQLDTIDNLVQRTGSDLHLALEGIATLSSTGSGTLSAATGTLQQSSIDLATLNTTIAAAQPLLANLSATVKDSDALVSNPAIPLLLSDLQEVAAHTDSITGDAAKVTHHYEQAIDNPKPTTAWQKFRTGLDVTWKILMLAK